MGVSSAMNFIFTNFETLKSRCSWFWPTDFKGMNHQSMMGWCLLSVGDLHSMRRGLAFVPSLLERCAAWLCACLSPRGWQVWLTGRFQVLTVKNCCIGGLEWKYKGVCHGFSHVFACGFRLPVVTMEIQLSSWMTISTSLQRRHFFGQNVNPRLVTTQCMTWLDRFVYHTCGGNPPKYGVGIANDIKNSFIIGSNDEDKIGTVWSMEIRKIPSVVHHKR